MTTMIQKLTNKIAFIDISLAGRLPGKESAEDELNRRIKELEGEQILLLNVSSHVYHANGKGARMMNAVFYQRVETVSAENIESEALSKIPTDEQERPM